MVHVCTACAKNKGNGESSCPEYEAKLSCCFENNYDHDTLYCLTGELQFSFGIPIDQSPC